MVTGTVKVMVVIRLSLEQGIRLGLEQGGLEGSYVVSKGGFESWF